MITRLNLKDNVSMYTAKYQVISKYINYLFFITLHLLKNSRLYDILKFILNSYQCYHNCNQ
jgi:hypothetical protein